MNMQSPDPEQQKVMQVYAAFMASLILSLLPFISAAFLSLLLAVVVLIMAYRFKSKAEPKGLLENHMIYVIRTIWIGAFIALLCMGISAAYLMINLDNTPLIDCVPGFQAMAADIYHPEIFKTVFSPCQEAYLAINMPVLIIGAGLAILAPVLYFSVRIIRGLYRASKGYRIAAPRSWL